MIPPKRSGVKLIDKLSRRLMKHLRAFSILLLATLCALPAAHAQSVTGQMSGTIADSANNAIAGAKAQLTNDLTKQMREIVTETSGSFIFPDLVPGDYSIQVTNPGFKAYVQHAINVSANEKVALHTIRMQIGNVTTS